MDASVQRCRLLALANLHNAMFLRASAADSRFSHGCRQVLFKSAQCAKPSHFL